VPIVGQLKNVRFNDVVLYMLHVRLFHFFFLTFDLFFNKPAPRAAWRHHGAQKNKCFPFPLKHTTPLLFLFFSHTPLYDFSEG